MAVDVDSSGNVYVADRHNHRIQKFAPDVPGWFQVNINGFGDRWNYDILSLAGFGNSLYAGTLNFNTGAQLWRRGSPWTAVTTDGFGNSYNVGIDHLIDFNGKLYAGTWADEVNGGEVWRSGTGNPGDWERVVSGGFGDATNAEIFRFAEFNNQLYATTWSYTDTHGLEIWRSSTGSGGDWTRVVSNGFNGDANNIGTLALDVFNGYLYAGTYNGLTGGEVWRSSTGNSGEWAQVNADGFDADAGNYGVTALTAFDGYLYGSTAHSSGAGAEVWRCQVCDDASDWEKVVDNGFGNANTGYAPALEVFDGYLYLVVGNSATGMEVWRTADGTNWEQVGFAGFGDSNNRGPYWDNSVTVFNDNLYVGTWNYANGGEVWQLLHYVYLPLILKNY